MIEAQHKEQLKAYVKGIEGGDLKGISRGTLRGTLRGTIRDLVLCLAEMGGESTLVSAKNLVKAANMFTALCCANSNGAPPSHDTSAGEVSIASDLVG